jgi:hypothetical protein
MRLDMPPAEPAPPAVIETWGAIFTKSVTLRDVVGTRRSTESEMVVRVPVCVGLNSPALTPVTSTAARVATWFDRWKSRTSVCEKGTSWLSSVCGCRPMRRAVTE